ncbi:MAG: hypothetical protein NTY53_09990, partial [Kiritimatiellaeota bacterium]|nr:hypothetical protein [Kiritimatiellota bacterium]
AGVLLAGGWTAGAATPAKTFRAGASAMDVTPTNFPVIVNGGFFSQTANKVHDRLHMRWLVFDDGATRVALGVLDTCLIPAEFADEARTRASKATGIPPEHITLSATHTHSAPSLMQSLGTPLDTGYATYVLPRIVAGLQRAVENIAPARVGWAAVQAPQHTHTRVWIRRPDKMLTDPFGEVSVRAMMHPGYQDPATIGPSGPSDPELTMLAVQTPDGRPRAVLANFSMHYFGAPAISADYCGAIAEKLGPLLGAKDDFVGIMSQGTSGDQHWMDYSQPKRTHKLDDYAGELAQMVATACKAITFHDAVPLATRETTLQLATRQPDAKRLAWASDLVAKMGSRQPKERSEVYALEQLWLKDHPTRTVRLRALRIGDFGIATWPCEVFALSGLKVKSQSPLRPTMNIELANAEEGYIPPPDLFPLGGYNTWACRSAALETNAEPKIVDALLGLLEEVSGQPRRKVEVTNGDYAKLILAAKPLAYWRLEEWSGVAARDATEAHRDASYDAGVARWLKGPSSPAFSGVGAINRCPHFAGGKLSATLKELKSSYSVELWFWNGLPETVRQVTGVLFARNDEDDVRQGEFLTIGGAGKATGKLVYCGTVTGRTVIAPKTWNHVVLAHDGERATVYLNGQREPELTVSDPSLAHVSSQRIFLAGDAGNAANFEGKLDEIAIYNRSLSVAEINRHYQQAGVQP